jgi:hypothetical protein
VDTEAETLTWAHLELNFEGYICATHFDDTVRSSILFVEEYHFQRPNTRRGVTGGPSVFLPFSFSGFVNSKNPQKPSKNSKTWEAPKP